MISNFSVAESLIQHSFKEEHTLWGRQWGPSSFTCLPSNLNEKLWLLFPPLEPSSVVSTYPPFQRLQFSSVQCSRSVVSDSLQPHEPQYARPPCPSPTPRVHPNPCPLSRWCHPTISSSIIPFSSYTQSFPASGSFWISQLFASGGQSIWSFSFNSPFNEHPGLISFRMDWLDLLAVQGTRESSPTPQFKSINSSALSFLYSPTRSSIHDYWKNHSLD